MRDPEDKGHLLPNPDTAFIVKKIFEMANNGVSVSDIASYLNDCKYPTPSLYKKKEGSKQKFNPIWTVSSVKKILKNQMYTGDMVQNVQTKLSYKSQKKVALNKEAWIIVENTHESLVSKKVFNKVQSNVKRKKKTQTDREKRLHQESKAKRLPESAPDCGSTDLFRKREETDEGGSAASYYRNGLLGKFGA